MAKAKRADNSADNLAIMQMALAGYEVEKRRVEEHIREINSLLGGKRTKAGGAIERSGSEPESANPGARRSLSAAARKRIAAAQRKRWDEYRKNKAQAG
jgi:hypothetical protein